MNVREESAPVSVPLRIIDVLVVLGLVLGSLSALGNAYGGWRWLIAGAAGAAVGCGVAVLSWRFRLSIWPTTLVATLGYFLVGSVVAVPDYAAAGYLPNAATVRHLASGLVASWRDSVTAFSPMGQTDVVLVVPFLSSLLAALIALLLLWRSKWAGTAVVPLAAMLVVAVAFGDRDAGATLVRGSTLLVSVLLWMRWRSLRHVRAHWARRISLTAAVLVVAGTVGGALAATTEPDLPRSVIRDHVDPPFDPLDYKSPLSAFRAYLKDLKDTDLFEVDGLPANTLIRLATMDRFDGTVWNVTGGAGSGDSSGTFKRVSNGAGGSTTYSITIGDAFKGVWIPSAGDERAVSVAAPSGADDVPRGTLINSATGTMAQVGGLRSGTRYTVRTDLAKTRTLEEIESAVSATDTPLVPPVAVPESLASRTSQWMSAAGANTGGAIAAELVNRLVKGFYSDGVEISPTDARSLAGHGSFRLNELFKGPQMVGNDEQYASAMAVAAQGLGVPARTVIGFRDDDGNGRIVGNEVIAWVQVRLKGLGWVDLLPTPDEQRKLKQQIKEPDPAPQPQVIPPPEIPQDPSQEDQELGQGSGKPPSAGLFGWLSIVLKVVGYLVLVVLVLSPIWGILLAKAVRRRRRRAQSDPISRLSGGWRELTDSARDLGTRLPQSNTRYENSVVLAQRFPEASLPALATIADGYVFSTVQPNPDDVADYWRDVETARASMLRAVPRWRRVLAAVSLGSADWPVVRATVTGSRPVRWVIVRGGQAITWTRDRFRKGAS